MVTNSDTENNDILTGKNKSHVVISSDLHVVLSLKELPDLKLIQTR